jgi:hypothetical protein
VAWLYASLMVVTFIRLVNYNKEKFGGKTDEWLWQKVIRDIERDRR